MERNGYRLRKIEGKYKLREMESWEILPVIESLPLTTDENQQLAISAFGTNDYRGNIEHMRLCSFKPVTTAESISALASFEDLARDILNIGWLQAGYFVETPEWFVFNPPVTEQGNPIIDERTLKQYLDKARKVNGIYRIPNKTIEGVRDCSFVPYESFKQGGLQAHEAYHQSNEDFSSSGLARGIAYAEGEKALNFETFLKRNYPKEVSIWAFGISEKPVFPRKKSLLAKLFGTSEKPDQASIPRKPELQVLCLHHGGGWDSLNYGWDTLVINGYNKPIDYGWRDGFAFGKREQLENM